MKKNVCLVLILSSLACYAQEQYKPEKGSFTTEMQFTPFGFNAKVDYNNDRVDFSTGPFSMDGLRLRYFVSDKTALRVSLGYNNDQGSRTIDLDDISEDSYSKTVVTGESSEKYSKTTFSLSPGFEFHFGNWERLSVYFGMEAVLGLTSSKSKVEQDVTRLYYSNNWGEPNFTLHNTYTNKSTIELENSTVGCYDGWCEYGYVQNAPMFFGANILLGMDFYIYKGLYMGAEFGFGYTYNKLRKGSYKEDTVTTRKYTNGNTDTTKISEDEKLEDKITSSNLGFWYNPMIRLGWCF